MTSPLSIGLHEAAYTSQPPCFGHHLFSVQYVAVDDCWQVTTMDGVASPSGLASNMTLV